MIDADSLTPTDIAQHGRLGIPPELLAAVARRVTDKEARETLGVTHRGDLAGVVYARLDPETGDPRGYRLRRDHPEIEHGKPRDKYLSSVDRPALFFAPGAGALLTDITIPIVFVEAEKSCLALTAAADRVGRPVLAIALGGCWGWRGRIGKTTDATGARVDEKGPLPDLDRLAWRGRDIVILFDANATNSGVLAGRRAFAADLLKRNARVLVADLPVEPGINGPDDYVAVQGDAALFTLIDAAQPVQPESAADVLRLAGLDDIHGVPLPDLEPRLRRLKDGLHGADAIRRRTVRELLVAALKTEKISSAAALADAAIGTPEIDAESEAVSFILADDAPALSPVDGADLFAETAARLQRHIVMSAAQTVAMTLWIAAVYAIDAIQRMAMLLISSPTPECGKSTAATLVSALVPRPVMVASLTPAVLYRLIDKYHPTLIADEVDAWLTDEKSELRGVFNAAHWRSGAFIPRCVGDDHDVQLFNVFGPKLIAMIGRPASTMLSRSITVTLQRKTARDRVEPLRDEGIRHELAPLRQRWRRWALDHLDRLRSHEPTMPVGLPVNRASDNWRPLLSIAEIVGGEWPTRAGAAALTLSGVRVMEDEPINVQLLADLQVVFRGRERDAYLSSEEIIESLKALPERPWADWNKGRGISPAQLAARVRDFDPISPLGLRTRKTRIGEKTAQRWHREDFIDPWSRYLVTEPEHPEQLNESGPKVTLSNPEHPSRVPGSENAILPMIPASVPGVPASESPKPARERERVEI